MCSNVQPDKTGPHWHCAAHARPSLHRRRRRYAHYADVSMSQKMATLDTALGILSQPCGGGQRSGRHLPCSAVASELIAFRRIESVRSLVAALMDDLRVKSMPAALAEHAELQACSVVWALPGHICTGTGLAPPTSAPRLSSPRAHLHRDWAHPLPHLHRDWARSLGPFLPHCLACIQRVRSASERLCAPAPLLLPSRRLLASALASAPLAAQTAHPLYRIGQGAAFPHRTFLCVQAFAESLGFSGPLQQWDTTYYAEKLKEAKYAFNEEVPPALRRGNVQRAMCLGRERGGCVCECV